MDHHILLSHGFALMASVLGGISSKAKRSTSVIGRGHGPKAKPTTAAPGAGKMLPEDEGIIVGQPGPEKPGG